MTTLNADDDIHSFVLSLKRSSKFGSLFIDFDATITNCMHFETKQRYADKQDLSDLINLDIRRFLQCLILHQITFSIVSNQSFDVIRAVLNANHLKEDVISNHIIFSSIDPLNRGGGSKLDRLKDMRSKDIYIDDSPEKEFDLPDGCFCIDQLNFTPGKLSIQKLRAAISSFIQLEGSTTSIQNRRHSDCVLDSSTSLLFRRRRSGTI